MTKRKLGLLLISLLLGACTLFGGSSPESTSATLPNPGVTTVPAPDAEAAAREFLEAWAQGAYGDMYAMLSPLSREWISEEAFIAEYRWFRASTALAQLEYEIISALVNPDAAEVRFRVDYNSASVGIFQRENRLELTRSDEDWLIAWSRQAILPDLEEGYDLYLEISAHTRANIYDRDGAGACKSNRHCVVGAGTGADWGWGC